MKKTIFFYGIGIISCLFVLYVMIVSLPNAIKTRYPIFSKKLMRVLPEGWGFFTKNPQSEIVEIYAIDSNEVLHKVNFKNNTASNFFGANRASRMIYEYVGKMISELKENQWVANENALQRLNMDSFPLNIFTMPKEFHLQGKYLIRKFNPLPWSWFSVSKPAIPIVKSSLLTLINIHYASPPSPN